MASFGEVITIVVILIILLIVLPGLFLLVTRGTGVLSYYTEYLTGIIASGGIFLFVLFVGVILLVGGMIFAGVIASYGNPKIARWISYLGVLLIMFSFIYLEFGILSSVVSESIKNKKAYFLPCDDFTNKPIMDMASCIVLGYAPSTGIARGLSYYSFWIFSLVVPILIIVYLFMDAVENSQIISNPFYAKIIGIGLGLMAYRGFLVTKLIFVLDFGAAGVALLLINFLFMGIIFSKVRVFFNTYQQLEDVIETRSEYKTWRPLLEREIWSASVSAEAMKKLAADAGFRTRLNNVIGESAAGTIFNEMANVQDTTQARNVAQKIINRLRRS